MTPPDNASPADLAPFPSILRCQGRSLVDASGAVLPRMKGFNVQPAGWPAQAFVDMHTLGARIVRTLVFWDQIEPTAGAINASYISKLDGHFARCKAAGLYTVLSLYYGPGGKHCPSWVGGSAIGNYAKHGQNVTQYLAKRYGGDPTVIGLGINEPTPDSQTYGYLWNATTKQPGPSIAAQKQMIQWFRVSAPHWIGFVACAYGPSAPIPNAPGSGHSSDQRFAGMPADPFAGLGNWLMELHCYFETTRDAASRTWDGRNSYGMPDNANTVKADSYPYPPLGISRAKCQASLAAFFAPYKAYGNLAGVPLAVGETGFKVQYAGADLYAADVSAAAAAAGAAIFAQWDYNTSTGNDPWAARNGGAWGKFAQTMMSAP